MRTASFYPVPYSTFCGSKYVCTCYQLIRELPRVSSICVSFANFLIFLIESKLRCSVVLPLSDVTPYWFPEKISFVKDAFLLGNKAITGIIQIPSKSGFVPDLLGLSKGLWVIRVAPDKGGEVIGPSLGKVALTSLTSTSKNSHFVCVRDFIIRFLLINKFPRRVLLVHTDFNNLSKEHLYRNEFKQLTMAFNELDLMESSLLSIIESNELIHSIVPPVIVTQNYFINARAELINIKLKIFVKHMVIDIKKVHLYDTVHLIENDHSRRRNLPILCSGCQTMNDDNSVYCKMCGVKLGSQTSASPSNIMNNDTLKAIESRMAYLDA
ncbi:hypothetical protein MAR_014742 [Mya arenaria]|uniref:Zinc ribbon domain-containing protein n=1 Tax=Mya arenaria TaxID=6604 RepID=A0ABY7FJA6_MYAAR|nr:hypothetical protein MAR_014742 [Mya arenaria]